MIRRISAHQGLSTPGQDLYSVARDRGTTWLDVFTQSIQRAFRRSDEILVPGEEEQKLNNLSVQSEPRPLMETVRQPEGLVRWSDIVRLMKLTAGAGLATLVPQTLDEAVVKTLLRHHPATRPKKIAELAARMAEVLSPRRTGNWQALAEEHARLSMEDSWGRLRGIGLRHWRPVIEFSGEQRLLRGLEAGRGAVIWCMRFSSATILKQGFYELGLPLVHLSFAEHGAGSKTTLGISVLGPLFCRAENIYLADRVIIPLGESLGYLQTLRDHLRKNACVSIFGDRTGRSSIEVPFFAGSRKFATGAPSLAWTENSMLLSAYAIRNGPFQYRVVVDEPIPVDRSVNRKAFVKTAVVEFARRLEQTIERHPADWQEWTEWSS